MVCVKDLILSKNKLINDLHFFLPKRLLIYFSLVNIEQNYTIIPYDYKFTYVYQSLNMCETTTKVPELFSFLLNALSKHTT